jgi:hypothetical protein
VSIVHGSSIPSEALVIFPFSNFFLLYVRQIIEEGPLKFRGEYYHPYHFNCKNCGVELTADAREVTHRPGFTAQVLVSSISDLR